MWGVLVVMEMFYILTVSMSILIVIYCFARYYHCGKLGKGYIRSLNYFFKLHVNLQLSQNRKFNLKKFLWIKKQSTYISVYLNLKRRLAGYFLTKLKHGSWFQLSVCSFWLCSCYSVNKLTPCGGKIMAIRSIPVERGASLFPIYWFLFSLLRLHGYPWRSHCLQELG